MEIPLFTWITLSTSLIVVVVGVLRFKVLIPELKILLLFLCIVLINNIMLVYWSILKINSSIFLHFYTLIEYAFLAYILSRWIKSDKFRKNVQLSIVFFFLIWLIAKFTFEKLDQFDSATATLSHFLLIIFSATSLMEINRELLEKIYKDPRFWVVSAILLYSTGSVIWLALGNYIITWPRAQMMVAWSLHWLLDIFTNFLYMGGFLCPDHR
ncbi:MAG: hypothetical protein D6748_08375 [Calditrichaeota bacterium]|nr:MAG: hypothetical protein D6748_08375 [Calditrichota bacterium]